MAGWVLYGRTGHWYRMSKRFMEARSENIKQRAVTLVIVVALVT